MTPVQFLARVKKGDIPAVCLFLGSEAYERGRCRDALIAAHLGENTGDGLAQYDLSQTSLTDVVDDARALSLFASQRLILATSAEAALPRVLRAANEDEDEDAPSGASDSELAAYIKSPTPGTLLLFEATRFDLEGEEKKKTDRIRKFYSAITNVVEFKRFDADEARVELTGMARRMKLSIDPAAAALLVEALAADVGRIATELEKLSLYVGQGGTVTADVVQALVPDARASTAFALVNALGRGDRARAMASLDALCRENEYLPLSLAFLSSQYRQALAARRAGLQSAQQVQSYFSKAGVPMWGSRSEQVAQTAQKRSEEQLEIGLKLIFEADRDLRSARPDDRIVMEQFIIRLTGGRG
jgi:DNA polymerase-3 subunit delta